MVSPRQTMIEVEHLTKDYGTVVAVRDVSFSVGRGEVVGFLGPNGAGKSTTMRILVGFLGATAGRVTIDGHDIVEDSLKARAAIGYMPEAAPLYGEMRVREYLTFRARAKNVSRGERKAAVQRAMAQAVVSEMSETLIGHLSKGYRQRVGLADALVSNPPLLILDEPTAGLDPNQIREVRALIRELGQEHTILLSTHILSEVESTCDRALLINRGSLVAEGSLDELRAQRRASSVRLQLRDPQQLAAKKLKQLAGCRRLVSESLDSERKLLRIELAAESEPGDFLEQAIALLVNSGVGVLEAAPEKASLEQVFAQLTGAEAQS